MKELQRILFCWRGLWMAIVACVTLWLAAPTRLSLACGLGLACLGEWVRFWAIGYSGESTRKQCLEAPQLITSGPYARIRNPLYLGNLLNAAGVLWAAYASFAPSLAAILFLLVVTLYKAIIDLEQKFLLERFGEEYRDYCRRVPSLCPRLAPPLAGDGPNERFCWRRGLRFEWTSLFWWLVVWGLLVSKLTWR